MDTPRDVQQTLERLQASVGQLDQRLRRLERAGDLQEDAPVPLAAAAAAAPDAAESRDGKGLEFEIGERWLGPVGIVVLLVGITFFISYPFGPSFPPGLQILVSYLAALGMFALGRWGRDTLRYTAQILLTGGLALLYLSTMRLHFFSPDPLIDSRGLGVALLLPVVALAFFAAVRRDAEHLALSGLVLGLITSLSSDAPLFALSVLVASSAALVAISMQQRWRRALMVGPLLVYGAHLAWLLRSSTPDGALGVGPEHAYNIVCLFGYAALFGLVDVLQPREDAWDASGFFLAFSNGAAFLALGTLVGTAQLEASAPLVLGGMAAAFLVLATIYWTRPQRPLETAVYACFGYVALSLAIVLQFGSPERFVWLGWQSLLVISTAIWFRSKIIVVSNLFIYVIILLVYLLLEPPDLMANLSYAAVALLSARLMKWQQERLTLRTDSMRTLYLASAFVIVPYALYHGVPASYVSLSWVGAAGFYFAMSLILQNQKYRWMAILTMLMTVVYVFAVDLGRLSPVFRIVSLLVLGVSLLVVSVMYSRSRRADGTGG